MERAFTTFLNGTGTEPPAFAHKHYWRAIRVFLGHVERISERRWGLILMSRNSVDDSVDGEPLGHADISACREDLYIPLSPQKA